MLTDWDTLAGYFPVLLEGAATTLLLFFLTLVIGFIIALPVALARNSKNNYARAFGHSFIYFFRGAPLLAILFLTYYGLPQIPGVKESFVWFFIRDPFPVAVIALALNSSGFQAEIIAGALRNVPKGEVEAAQAAGFSRMFVFVHIAAPHAIRLGLRSFGNEAVLIIKGTAVVSFITIQDLISAANQVYFNTLDPISPLLIAGLFYLSLVFLLSRLFRKLEYRLDPRLRT